MRGLVHVLATLVALPYALLAAAFLLVGQAARARGLLGVFNVVLSNADWFARWGIYVLPVVYLALAAAGFSPGLRRIGALSLVVLSAVSLVIIWALHSGKLSIGQWVFLTPCVGVIVTSVWLFRTAAR
ncbi:MAG: hypothetical protein ABMA00_14585 [Gemmatimonas sp.]